MRFRTAEFSERFNKYNMLNKLISVYISIKCLNGMILNASVRHFSRYHKSMRYLSYNGLITKSTTEQGGIMFSSYA